ncbi:glycosyltransferase family 23 protein [Pseudoscourfieldia marina]
MASPARARGDDGHVLLVVSPSSRSSCSYRRHSRHNLHGPARLVSVWLWFALVLVVLCSLRVGSASAASGSGLDVSESAHFTACLTAKADDVRQSEDVQTAIFARQNPSNCATQKFLICDSKGGGDQGTGSRYYFLSRCIGKAFGLNRVAVLDPKQSGTHLMTSPFLPWTNCTLGDAKKSKQPITFHSISTQPSKDGVKGAIIPPQYEHKGYFWWKAQEIAYVLRPTPATAKELKEKMRKLGWTNGNSDSDRVHGMQVRRTDKVAGKLKESDAHPVAFYERHLEAIARGANPPRWHDSSPERTLRTFIASDDAAVKREAATLKVATSLPFEAAPKRTIGKFNGRAMKDALDILLLSHTDLYVFAYSSGFAAMALLLKLQRDGFCANFASVDRGKREWPKIMLYGDGGGTGIPRNTPLASKLCHTVYEKKPPRMKDAEHVQFMASGGPPVSEWQGRPCLVRLIPMQPGRSEKNGGTIISRCLC